MDTGHSFSKSELSVLWNRRSNRYTIKSFIENGLWITHLVLHDKCAGGTVIGKLVKRSSAEFRQRPWLHHRNLASLIDMVTIHDEFTVFISVYQDMSLREIVHNIPFVQSSNCFVLKKIYIEDVLWGLDYLHRNGLCLMNLTDANVFICEQPNKAIITDFGCLTQVNNREECKFAVPFVHQPPETRMDGEYDLIAAEMWVIGMMVLEIFTQHKLPWALVDYDPDRVQEMIAKVDYGLLKIANAGSTLSIQDLCEFKTFVGLFIDDNPQRRCSARDAASTVFVQSPKHGVSLQNAVILSSNSHGKKESVSFPTIHQLACNLKHSCRSNNDIHTLKTTRSHLDENKTEKSRSNLSFKNYVYSANQINSDQQSHDIQQSKYVDFDNDVVSDNSDQDDKFNSETKSTLYLDIQHPNLTDFNIDAISDTTNQVDKVNSETKSLINIDPTLSSQIELPSCTPKKSVNIIELNSNMPASEYSDNIRNEEIDFIPMSRPFDAYDYYPTPIKKESDSIKKLSPEKEDNLNNILSELRRNMLNENKTNDSPARNAYLENSLKKVSVPCNIDTCTSSTNNYNNCYQHTTSDQFDTNRNDSIRNKIDGYNRHWKPVVLNNSFQKPHVPFSNNPEICSFNSKPESKIVSKSPYTLSKNNFSSLQKSTTNNASDLMANTNHIIKNELEKEMDQEMFRHSEQIKEQKSLLYNNIKSQNMPISDFKRSNLPSAGAEKFVLKRIPVQKNVNHCRFQHGYRCPKHQKAKLLDNMINQEANFLLNNKEYTSKNKCKTCGNIHIEPKVTDNNHENTLAFPNGRYLPHEFWFPAKTHFNQRNSPILSPSPLSQISGKSAPEKDAKNSACGPIGLSYTQETWDGEGLNKSYSTIKDTGKIPDEEEQPVILIHGPRVKGRHLFRVERVNTKSDEKYMKKNAKKGALKKCKKTKKYSSTECIVAGDSGEEKKSSKKMKSLKKCFCIGK